MKRMPENGFELTLWILANDYKNVRHLREDLKVLKNLPPLLRKLRKYLPPELMEELKEVLSDMETAGYFRGRRDVIVENQL